MNIEKDAREKENIEREREGERKSNFSTEKRVHVLRLNTVFVRPTYDFQGSQSDLGGLGSGTRWRVEFILGGGTRRGGPTETPQGPYRSCLPRSTPGPTRVLSLLQYQDKTGSSRTKPVGHEGTRLGTPLPSVNVPSPKLCSMSFQGRSPPVD